CSCQKRQKTATLKPFESAFYPRFCWRHYAAHPRLLYAAPRQLDSIIKQRKEKAEEYEQYLQRIAQLVQQVEAGMAEDAPIELTTPGRRALYNNLQPWLAGKPTYHVAESTPEASNPALVLALLVDQTVKAVRPDSWRGNPAKENTIKAALFALLHDAEQVERIFVIVSAQGEY
ncbi:hypothetical protein KDX26_33695, partial [Burkholderia cenocepacia]|nr:hypothetical protein [Burkholderia cenocepacia]